MALTAQAPLTTEAGRIAEFLGLGPEVHDRIALARLVASGLPLSAATTVAESVGMPMFESVIPSATFRRARSKRAPLSRETSEKLYEFSRVLDQALRIYGGNREQAQRFLNRPHAMLDGQTPLALATSSSAGADAVADLLVRAEAGFAA